MPRTTVQRKLVQLKEMGAIKFSPIATLEWRLHRGP
jgi:hypothetical protein